MEVTFENVWPEWEKETEKPIGHGGYGKVYKAVRKDTGAKAAIKIVSIPENQLEIQYMLDCGKSTDEIKQELLTKAYNVINEIKVMQSLKGSNNIVAIEDSVMREKSDGIGYDVFIRMELLVPIKTHFARKHINPEEVIKLGCDICSALEVCHRNIPSEKKAIIHRDIKPDNILYHKVSDSFKLGDFGISRELVSEKFDCTRGTGTANFMAPEVASLKEYDVRADIYSLGLVLYYLLNDQKMPFVSHGAVSIPGETEIALRKRLSGAKLNPPVNSYVQLSGVILKACSFSPDERYSTATEMKKALEKSRLTENIEEVVHPINISSPMEEPIGTFGPKRKKRKSLWVAGILALILLTSMLGSRLMGIKVSDLPYGEQNTSNTTKSIHTNNNDFATSTKADSSAATIDASIGVPQEANPLAEDHTLDPEKPQNNPLSKQPNDSRENAYLLEFDHAQSGAIGEDEANWYKFATSNNISAYRIGASPKNIESSKHTYTYLKVALFDGDGFKKEEFLVHNMDAYDFIDLYLIPSTEYYIKVYVDDVGYSSTSLGGYELWVSEMVCDAGLDKNSAAEITIDTKHSAILNSTLSDWHKFNVEESGEYRITLHNIDVGCDIYISVKQPVSAGEGFSVANEDNHSWTIDVSEGDTVYFEIYSYAENPVANGTYILVVEKEEN